MTTDDRRAFLKKMAKGVAYSAPVVYTMAAPVDLLGQGMSSGKGMGKGMDMDGEKGMSGMFWTEPPGGSPPGT